MSFIQLCKTSPDVFRGIFISRFRTPSEQQFIRETNQELRTRKNRGEANISISFFNGVPQMVLIMQIEQEAQKTRLMHVQLFLYTV